MKMIELAFKSKHVANFVQISTAYVNCDKLGLKLIIIRGRFIEEKIYDEPYDVERFVADLTRTAVNLTEKQTK